MKRWLTRIGLGFFGGLALALACGAVYEAHARRHLAERFPLPGKRVNIGQRALHLDCRGVGSPTVVFESGLDSSGALGWEPVHDEIARLTRACSYSRAGILSSDPGVTPRDADAITDDLQALLAHAGERSPLVLVAHSLGGLYAITYTGKFGADVAGLVLVDTFHADSTRSMAEAGIHLPDPLRPLQIASALSWTGLVRLLFGANDAVAAYDPTSIGELCNELEALDRSAAQAGARRQLGDRPLYVLTAGRIEEEFRAAAELSAEQGRQFLAVKQRLDEDQASWSTRGRHEVVPGSAHSIQWERPERVIDATRWVIDAVRSKPAP